VSGPGGARVQLRAGRGRALFTLVGGAVLGGAIVCGGLFALQLAPVALGAVLLLGGLAATPGLRLPAFDAEGAWVARAPWSARALRPWAGLTELQVLPRPLVAGRSAEIELRLVHPDGHTLVRLRDPAEAEAVAALVEAHVPAQIPGARALRAAIPRAFGG
jgi:hypothetical protein